MSADIDGMELQHLLQDYNVLLDVCRIALAHINELESAWQRGAITEHDGLGGTRSNRNIEVRVRLEAVIPRDV